MVARGKIVKNPDENCFDCGRHFDVLDYFICGNGEWQGHCLECLEVIQNGTPEQYQELIRKKFKNPYFHSQKPNDSRQDEFQPDE